MSGGKRTKDRRSMEKLMLENGNLNDYYGDKGKKEDAESKKKREKEKEENLKYHEDEQEAIMLMEQRLEREERGIYDE